MFVGHREHLTHNYILLHDRSTARAGQTVTAAMLGDAAFLLVLAWVLYVQPGICFMVKALAYVPTCVVASPSSSDYKLRALRLALAPPYFLGKIMD
jgi:hypothetical protein